MLTTMWIIVTTLVVEIILSRSGISEAIEVIVKKFRLYIGGGVTTRLIVCLFLCLLVFFAIGFAFYKPPKKKAAYEPVLMPIERPNQEATSNTPEGKENDKEVKDKAARVKLPPLGEIDRRIEVARQYDALLAQMNKALTRMSPLQPKEVDEIWEGFMLRGEGDPAIGGIASGVPLEVTVRERLQVIKEVLEYASAQAGIPVEVLAAVAWAETTIFPYAINHGGRTSYFTSKREALKALARIETTDIDIGILQVNYRLWGEPLGLKKEDLLDPQVCILMGAMILKYHLQRHRDPWVAIGRYHSADQERMRAYQAKVSEGLEIIRGLYADDVRGHRPRLSHLRPEDMET